MSTGDLCDIKACPNPKDPEGIIEVFVPDPAGGGWGSPRRGITARIGVCAGHRRILADKSTQGLSIGTPVEP